MSRQGTVVEQKQLFLQSRKQLLSRGIPPSERLRTIAEDGGIELSVLKGVMDKVNRELKQHSRKVYSRQIMEHVVQQVDELYWESGLQEVDETDDVATDITDDANTLHQNDDLTHEDNIAKLPRLWDTSSEPTSSRTADATQDDYLASLARLQGLSARRQTLQNKLSTQKTLLSLLEPYRKPKNNIQPNLVWKESPLAPELMTTRTLAIRVAARVGERFGGLQAPSTAEEEEDVDMDGLQNEGRRKVNNVLASW